MSHTKTRLILTTGRCIYPAKSPAIHDGVTGIMAVCGNAHDAAHIVRCVNSHEALLTTLMETKNFLQGNAIQYGAQSLLDAIERHLDEAQP